MCLENNRYLATKCGDSGESTTVGPASPGIVTKAQTPVTVGGTAHDTATLSGLVSADGTGTVTFTAYSDSLCKTTALFSSTVPSSGGISANGDIDRKGVA